MCVCVCVCVLCNSVVQGVESFAIVCSGVECCAIHVMCSGGTVLMCTCVCDGLQWCL